MTDSAWGHDVPAGETSQHATPPPDLIAVIRGARTTPGGWRTPAARQVLTEARRRLQWTAKECGTTPDDAVSHAFEVWMNASLELLEQPGLNMWAYTQKAVRNALQREQEAARKHVSATSVRHKSVREACSVAPIDDQNLTVTVDHDEPRPPTLVIPAEQRHAITTLNQVLIMAGFNADQRALFIDALATIVDESTSLRTAAARLTTSDIRHDYPLTASQWRALVAVMLGTQRGKPGMVELLGQGHPAPALAPHISAAMVEMLTGEVVAA